MEALAAGEDDLRSQALVSNHMLAYVDTMVLKCALKLGLFDAICLHASLPDLAAYLHVDSSALRRIVRYLVHMRLVNSRPAAPPFDHETYSLTAAAAAYLPEASGRSQAPFVRFLVEDDMMAAMHCIDEYLVGGDQLPVERLRGERFFDWVGRDPALGRRFDDAMTCTAMPAVRAVVDGCPAVFEGVKVLVDVGGGDGAVAAAIARAFPWITCVVYDLGRSAADGVEMERVIFRAGDMFDSVPRADAVLLMRVLHNWNDEKAIEILKRCREAVVEGDGKVIIVDMLIDDDESRDVEHVKLAYDVLMMTYVGGRERTMKEWQGMLFKAGFISCTVTHVKALQHVIEARP